MAPDIVLARRHVQVAREQRAPRRVRPEPRRRLVQERELVGELGVRRRVRHIAARRDVEAVHGERPGRKRHVRREMPAIAPAAPVGRGLVERERDAREDRDAVIPLHPPAQHVRVAERARRPVREQLVRHLGLLQEDQVGIEAANHPLQVRQAQAERVDVPGGESQAGHGASGAPSLS